jgi:hypothetical protein
MKKFIITALLAASTSSAFAIDHMLINGKKLRWKIHVAL